MNTKIRVEYDLDKKEPYLQFTLNVLPTQSVEIADQMLRHLAKQAETNPIVFIPGEQNNPQIRIVDNNSNSSCFFLETIGNWARPFFYNVSDKEERELGLGALYTNFFNRLQSCLDDIHHEAWQKHNGLPLTKS